MDSCRTSREPAMHICPQEAKTPSTTASTARSRSASGKRICGDLPPSSNATGVRLAAAERAMALPVSWWPVNTIRSTSGCATSATPVSRPPGAPAPTLRHTRLGQQLAQQQGGQRRLLGRFEHAGVAEGERRCDLLGREEVRHVPRDDAGDDAVRLGHACRCGTPVRPGSSRRGPARRSPRSSGSCRPPGRTSRRVSLRILPVLRVSVSASSSSRASMRSATACRIRPRSLPVRRAHAGWAARAARTAASTSAGEAGATRVRTWPSIGEKTSAIGVPFVVSRARPASRVHRPGEVLGHPDVQHGRDAVPRHRRAGPVQGRGQVGCPDHPLAVAAL